MVVAAKVIKVEAVEEQVAESPGTVTKKTKKETCVHHWLIEEAKKPTSTGRCKKCHEVKDQPVDLVIPEHIQTLALSVVIGAGQAENG